MSLQDWVPQRRQGDSIERIALIGDAAHAMVMCTYKISLLLPSLVPGFLVLRDLQNYNSDKASPG